MCFHCKMFPIKKQFREHHINKWLVFRKGQRFWNAGWTNTHTYTYSATRRLLQQHLIHSKLEFVQLRPGERWKTSWLSLKKKHLKFIQHHPDLRIPKPNTTLAHMSSAGISKDWNILSLSSPTCKMRLLGSVVCEGFRVLQGILIDCPQTFLILAIGKVD